MIPDTSIRFAGLTITTLQLLGLGGLLLAIAAFLLAFSRERRMAIKRSIVTDELAVQLGRIADSLERVANQASDRAMRKASRQPAEASRKEPEVASPETHRVAFSMFGR
jgi:hypothetical protein